MISLILFFKAKSKLVEIVTNDPFFLPFRSYLMFVSRHEVVCELSIGLGSVVVPQFRFRNFPPNNHPTWPGKGSERRGERVKVSLFGQQSGSVCVIVKITTMFLYWYD